MASLKALTKELKKETVVSLRAKAKSLNLRGYTGLNKEALVKFIAAEMAIAQPEPAPEVVTEPQPEPAPEVVTEPQPEPAPEVVTEPQPEPAPESDRAPAPGFTDVKQASIALNMVGTYTINRLVASLESEAKKKSVLGSLQLSLSEICKFIVLTFGISGYLTSDELEEGVKSTAQGAIEFTRQAPYRIKKVLIPLAVLLARQFWLHFEHTLNLCKEYLKSK